MEFSVRAATLSDYEELCGLFDEGDALHRDNLPGIFQKPQGPSRDRDYVLGLISEESVGLFVAQIDSQLVGLICIIIRESPAVPILVPRRFAVVDNLVVRKRFRRMGIDRALVDRAHAWAAANEIDTIELNVWEFNRDAIEFYHHLGYAAASRKMSTRLSERSITPTTTPK